MIDSYCKHYWKQWKTLSARNNLLTPCWLVVDEESDSDQDEQEPEEREETEKKSSVSYHEPIERPHDKTNKMTVHPAKTRSAWASAQSDQSSLFPWRSIGSLATHRVHSEDSDQTGWMPRLIWVFAGHTCHFVGFAMQRLYFAAINNGMQALPNVHSYAATNFHISTCPFSRHWWIKFLRRSNCPEIFFFTKVMKINRKKWFFYNGLKCHYIGFPHDLEILKETEIWKRSLEKWKWLNYLSMALWLFLETSSMSIFRNGVGRP